MTTAKERLTMRTDKCSCGDGQLVSRWSRSARSRPGSLPSPRTGPLRSSNPSLVALSGLGEKAWKATAGLLPAVATRSRGRARAQDRSGRLALLSRQFPSQASQHWSPQLPLSPWGPRHSASKLVLSQLFFTRSSSEAIISNGPGSLPIS